MLDLYFSNRKKSLGGHVSQIISDNSQTSALVVFEDHKSEQIELLIIQNIFIFYFLSCKTCND